MRRQSNIHCVDCMACSGAIKEVCKKVVKIRFFHFLEVNFIFLKKFAGFNKPLQHTSVLVVLHQFLFWIVLFGGTF